MPELAHELTDLNKSMSSRPKPQRRVGVLHAAPLGGLSADVRVCRMAGGFRTLPGWTFCRPRSVA
jgi:hypothetical protein